VFDYIQIKIFRETAEVKKTKGNQDRDKFDEIFLRG